MNAEQIRHVEFLCVIEMLDSPAKEACRKLYLENQDIFDRCPGSSHNHQNWPGGYLDHMIELNKIAITSYEALEKIRPLPFSLGDALLALFAHDLEKPWKYAGRQQFNSDEERLTFVNNLLFDYKIPLKDAIWNAIKYAHGEGKDYRADQRIQTPLAAFVHCCDVISARIWFDQPAR